jgi:hypothetical protein
MGSVARIMKRVSERGMSVIGAGEADHPSFYIIRPVMTSPNGLVRDVEAVGALLRLDMCEFLLPIPSLCDCLF